MTVKELYDLVLLFHKDFKEFKKNDFTHLEHRVDRISVKVAWIVGVIFVLSVVSHVLLRVL